MKNIVKLNEKTKVKRRWNLRAVPAPPPHPANRDQRGEEGGGGNDRAPADRYLKSAAGFNMMFLVCRTPAFSR